MQGGFLLIYQYAIIPLIGHRTNSEPIVASIIVHPMVAIVVVQIVRIKGAIYGTRPIIPIFSFIIYGHAIAIPRSRQEYVIAIGACYSISVNAIKRSPSPRTFAA